MSERVNISNFDGDVRDSENLRRWANRVQPDVVYHLAAVVPTGVAAADQLATREVNEFGPQLVARAVLESANGKIVRFVYASTSHVYRSDNNRISENGALDPQNFYAETKLAGEIGLRKILSENPYLDLVIPRIFSVYSERQAESFLFPSLMRKIQPKPGPQQVSLPGWNNIRDFLHARQIAELLFLLAKSTLSGVVNLGSGRGQSVKRFAEELFGSDIQPGENDAHSIPTSLVANPTLISNAIGTQKFREIVNTQNRYNSDTKSFLSPS